MLKNVVKYYQPNVTEGLALSKGRKGGLKLNSYDLIQHYVDKYIAEKEKNIKLQQQIEQHKQMLDDRNVKTNK